MADNIRIDLCDKKYTYVLSFGGQQRALRYGEPWRDLTGDGFVLAMAQEIERLLESEDTLQNALMAEQTETHALREQLAAERDVLKPFAKLHVTRFMTDGCVLIASLGPAEPYRQINELKAENARLRAALAATEKERDRLCEAAEVEHKRLTAELAAERENGWKAHAANLSLAEENDALRAELTNAKKELEEAADDIEAWGAYAGDYFKDKHDLEGDVRRVKDAAAHIGAQLAKHQ